MSSINRSFDNLLLENSVLSSEASRVVAKLLGSKVNSVEMISQGVMTFKFLVETRGGQRVIVRFYPVRRSNIVNQEPDLLARCRVAGIPVPQMIGDSRNGPSSELNYVVYHMIEGMTLREYLATSNLEQQSLVAENIAKNLLKLKAIEFEGCGELVTAHKAFDSTWELFIEKSLCRGLEAIQRHSLLDKRMITEIKKIGTQRFIKRRKSMQSLVWGDINFENIIIGSNSNLVGFIDFESCLSGDPLATLGYCFAVHGKESFFSMVLNECFESVCDKDNELVFFYAILRVLRLAEYAHLPCPTGYARDPLTQIFPGIIPALEKLSY